MNGWRNDPCEHADGSRDTEPVPSQCQAEGTDRDACAGRAACPGCVETVTGRVAALDAFVASQRDGLMVDAAQLVGPAEVLALCGWKTRKSIGDQTDFPQPVAVVSGTRLWTRQQVTDWIAQRD